ARASRCAAHVPRAGPWPGPWPATAPQRLQPAATREQAGSCSPVPAFAAPFRLAHGEPADTGRNFAHVWHRAGPTRAPSAASAGQPSWRDPDPAGPAGAAAPVAPVAPVASVALAARSSRGRANVM